MSALDDLAHSLAAAIDRVDTSQNRTGEAGTAAATAVRAAEEYGRDSAITQADALRSEIEQLSGLVSQIRQKLEEALQRTQALQGGTGTSTSPSSGVSSNSSATISEPPTQPAGWSSPEVATHPLRVDPSTVRITNERRGHILDGDPKNPKSGGHRHGTGRPNKTEFPQRWDDDTAMGYIKETARSPGHIDFLPEAGKRPDRWMCQSDHDDVTVTAIVWPDGRVATAWLEPGGRGVVKNEGKKKS